MLILCQDDLLDALYYFLDSTVDVRTKEANISLRRYYWIYFAHPPMSSGNVGIIKYFAGVPRAKFRISGIAYVQTTGNFNERDGHEPRVARANLHAYRFITVTFKVVDERALRETRKTSKKTATRD